MPIHVRTGGVWQEVDPRMRIGGTWRDAKKVHVKVGGVWQQVYSGTDPIWTAGDTADDPGGPTYRAQIALNTDGTIDLRTDGVDGRWMPEGGTASDYRVRWDRIGGGSPYGSSGWTELTWLDMTANRTVFQDSAGTRLSSTVIITIEHVPTGATLSKTMTMLAGAP